MMTQREVRFLVTIQSVLVFLQVITAASALGDVVGLKVASLMAIIVAGAQQGVNFYLSKSVGETVQHVENVVNQATETTQDARTLAHKVTTMLAEQTTSASNVPAGYSLTKDEANG
jgi:hypothetical protein